MEKGAIQLQKIEEKEKQVDKKTEEIKKKEAELEKREKQVDKKVAEIDKKIEEVKKLSFVKKVSKRTFTSAKFLGKEFEKSINTAIIAAFGFIIALAWRDAITEYVSLVTKVTAFEEKLVTAILVTIISVTGILIITKLLPIEEKK